MSSEQPEPSSPRPRLPDGLVIFLKDDCPTCHLVVPVLSELAAVEPLTIYSQDNPEFPAIGQTIQDERDLSVSWHHDIETVPTLVKVLDGKEVARTVGWSRSHWEELTGEPDLGLSLPDHRPGCGSLSVDPANASELAARFQGGSLQSRRIEITESEDEYEAAFDRGWSDGLPVVLPTEARVLAMLSHTSRAPTDVVAAIPPDLHSATVEQVAVNAVLAGCKPEYFPVVLAAVEAACTQEFNMHGLIATTYFSGPIIVVNGPIAKAIGMNSGGNALGQGNRANLTIGRALQLVVRNLGGGHPGEIDMAVMGSPGKVGMCFAEREHDSPFAPLSVDRGLPEGTSAVTLFAGQGPTGVIDQLSRTPESLAKSLASSLRMVAHPKLIIGFDAMLVVSPEHGRIFRESGWDRKRLTTELEELLLTDGAPLVRGAGGITEGIPEAFGKETVPKFRPDGLQIVHAGGDAGLFSAILGGWVGGPMGSQPVTVPIVT